MNLFSMKLSIVKIISATTLGLFAAVEVVTAVSAVGYEKKVIASSFSSIEEAIAIAGLKLAIECKKKLDNLSDQAIDSKLQMLEVEKKSLEDPLAILFANKGKNLVSEDCSGTDREGFRSMISSVMAEYDIRLSEAKKMAKICREISFMLQPRYFLLIYAERIKGFTHQRKSAKSV